MKVMDMYKKYYGVIYFERFAGVKSGRSIWKQAHVKTQSYLLECNAVQELEYLRDVVLVAAGVKIKCYAIETMIVDDIPF